MFGGVREQTEISNAMQKIDLVASSKNTFYEMLTLDCVLRLQVRKKASKLLGRNVSNSSNLVIYYLFSFLFVF